MTELASSVASARGRVVAYWVTTALVAFQLGSGGAGDILRIPSVVEGMEHLGWLRPSTRRDIAPIKLNQSSVRVSHD